MHAFHLVELAGVVATHSNLISSFQAKLSPVAIEKFWASSKCRNDRWTRSLRMFQNDLSIKDANYSPWPAIESVAYEIFLSEMLIRVWTACSLLHEEKTEDDSLSTICRSVLLSHLEARSRALKLISIGVDQGISEAKRLNDLRAKMERWTDLLLARLPRLADKSLAFDEERVADFAQDFGESNDLEKQDAQHSVTSWEIMLASLGKSFAVSKDVPVANADLNDQIVLAIMSFFPPEIFDSVEFNSSMFLVRIHTAADDTERLVRDFLWNDIGFESKTDSVA